jgi:hypothetical protein
MSDTHSIEPVVPVEKAAPIIAIHPIRVIGDAVETKQQQSNPQTADSSTGGGLRAAYAQFVVNPDTNDVVIRIKDSATNEVLRELPSPEVEAMRAHINTYVQKLSQYRASHPVPQAAADFAN